jgi:hypothetical protein
VMLDPLYHIVRYEGNAILYAQVSDGIIVGFCVTAQAYKILTLS